MDFSAKIAAADADLLECKNDAAAIIGLAEAEERDISEEEKCQLEALTEKAEAATTRISSLKSAEKIMGLKAVEKSTKAPAFVKSQSLGSPKERKQGDLIVKMAANAFLAHQNKINPIQAVSSSMLMTLSFRCRPKSMYACAVSRYGIQSCLL